MSYRISGRRKAALSDLTWDHQKLIHGRKALPFPRTSRRKSASASVVWDAAGPEHLLVRAQVQRKRRYGQTEWLMIARGKRESVQRKSPEVVMPLVTAPDPPSQAERC